MAPHTPHTFGSATAKPGRSSGLREIEEKRFGRLEGFDL